LLLAVIGLWLADLRTPIESRHLLYVRIGLNFLFSTLVALLVAFKFGRSFLTHGAIGVLLFGCGAVIWGASGVISLITSLASAPGFDPNIPVTIHNVCIWTASLCQTAGAACLLRHGPQVSTPRPWLVGAYGLALGVVGLTVLATLLGWTSVFFVQGEGGTEVRWLVLGSTIAMLTLTTLLLRTAKRPRPSPFVDWYILSLLLLVISYLGLMLESVFAGPLGWVSAAAQYLGGVYMFVAALTAFRDADDPVAGLSQAQEEVRHPYAIAIVGVLVAAVLRLAFLHSLGTQAPFVTFYPAVILVALYGGLRAGALATVISAAATDYFWIVPVGSLYTPTLSAVEKCACVVIREGFKSAS
jgi:hypothetical protein